MPIKPQEPNDSSAAIADSAAFDDMLADELPTNSLIARRSGADTAGTAATRPQPPASRPHRATPLAPKSDVSAEPACDAAPARRKRKPRRTSATTETREGEAIRLWFRTERVFSQNGAWYISTREGIDVGPYDDVHSARADAKRLIRLLMQQGDADPQSQSLTIQQFMDRPRNRHR